MACTAVDILGVGASLPLFKDSGNDIFVSYARRDIADNCKGQVLTFGMHDSETFLADVTVDNFPFFEIRTNLSEDYYTSSIAYMIAYAISKDYEIINLYGIDMNAQDEYINQKACVLYWVGLARGLGIEVNITSDIDKGFFNYGDPKQQLFIKKLDQLYKHVEPQLLDGGDKAEQAKGFLFAIKTIKDMIN